MTLYNSDIEIVATTRMPDNAGIDDASELPLGEDEQGQEGEAQASRSSSFLGRIINPRNIIIVLSTGAFLLVSATAFAALAESNNAAAIAANYNYLPPTTPPLSSKSSKAPKAASSTTTSGDESSLSSSSSSDESSSSSGDDNGCDINIICYQDNFVVNGDCECECGLTQADCEQQCSGCILRVAAEGCLCN